MQRCSAVASTIAHSLRSHGRPRPSYSTISLLFPTTSYLRRALLITTNHVPSSLPRLLDSPLSLSLPPLPPCLLPSSSQTLFSRGPQPPWVLCASGAGPLLTHPCHPHPHFFASRIFPDLLPLANTHCEFSTLPGLAPVPPSPSRHIRAHTGLPPASSA